MISRRRVPLLGSLLPHSGAGLGTLRSSTAIGIAALVIGALGCGHADDGADVHVSTSETGNGDTTVVVHTPPDTVVRNNTIVQTDTVVREGVVVQKRTDTVVQTVPGSKTTIPITDQYKQLIDAWLQVHADSLNQYGDPKNTAYTGGTPLYNESTRESLTKYEYIIIKHPDKPWLRENLPVDSRRRR